MKKQPDGGRKAFYFLQARARSTESFTLDEINQATGWSGTTFETYKSKYLKGLVIQKDGQFVVKPEFLKIGPTQFQSLSTQVKNIFAKYDRLRYEEVFVFEFLLPLTREDELRTALDELFYADTLKQRLSEIGLEVIATWDGAERESGEQSDVYLERLVTMISDRFRGYSISHLQGRFRAGELLTRQDAAKWLESGQRYLIDETTASLRFIIPVENTRTAHSVGFGDLSSSAARPTLGLSQERSWVRRVFFDVFVEAVVRNVTDEDEIWLIEQSAAGPHLYVWRRQFAADDT